MFTSRAAGFAGACLVAAGGFGAGALPVGVPFFAGGTHVRAGLVAVYGGLALLLLGWWHGRRAELRVWPTLALWAGPLLVAPPLFSRDVYSYVAQGVLRSEGFDVYRVGPSQLGGLLAAQVPEMWQHAPSPYGPVFLVLAGLVSAQGHLLLSVIAMRLLAVAGLVLLAYAVPILARSTGARASTALWLAVFNPLVLIHFIGGAHNDALMVGLLAAGLAAAVRRHLVSATLLVVAAALVKAPAALGLVAVAMIWSTYGSRWRAVLSVGAVAAAATAFVTQVAGTGYGWVAALKTPISPQNLSLTSVLGRATAGLLRDDGVGETFVLDLWRWLGVLATVVVAGLVWASIDRFGPLYGLGVVLLAVVAFGPALRPWYLTWALVPLAAAAVQPWIRHVLAIACAVLALVVLPDGYAVNLEEFLLATTGVLAGVATFFGVRLGVFLGVRPVAAR